MTVRPPANQIPFRYRTIDSVIHYALHELAIKLLPQYEADEGPLTAAQMRQIKKRVPQGGKRSVRSSLFETQSA